MKEEKIEKKGRQEGHEICLWVKEKGEEEKKEKEKGHEICKK